MSEYIHITQDSKVLSKKMSDLKYNYFEVEILNGSGNTAFFGITNDLGKVNSYGLRYVSIDVWINITNEENFRFVKSATDYEDRTITVSGAGWYGIGFKKIGRNKIRVDVYKDDVLIGQETFGVDTSFDLDVFHPYAGMSWDNAYFNGNVYLEDIQFTRTAVKYARNIKVFLDTSDNVWGIDSTGIFDKLATNWSSKSDSDKLALIKAVEKFPTISDLSTIGKFKVISMNGDTPVTNTTVTAIPKTQTVYPTKLIKTSPFEKLNSVSINATSSGAGDIKVAVTTDLATYKVWDKVTLAWIDIPKSDIATRGMSVADVSALTDTEWNMLVSYGVGDGIAFAYSLDITADTDKAEIDELTLNAEMRGSWNKAFHGTDYTYGYPFYDQLSVKLLKDGSYKINYHD